jgi:hypothetical protein
MKLTRVPQGVGQSPPVGSAHGSSSSTIFQLRRSVPGKRIRAVWRSASSRLENSRGDRCHRWPPAACRRCFGKRPQRRTSTADRHRHAIGKMGVRSHQVQAMPQIVLLAGGTPPPARLPRVTRPRPVGAFMRSCELNNRDHLGAPRLGAEQHRGEDRDSGDGGADHASRSPCATRSRRMTGPAPLGRPRSPTDDSTSVGKRSDR